VELYLHSTGFIAEYFVKRGDNFNFTFEKP
jgi:hypothetical protein